MIQTSPAKATKSKAEAYVKVSRLMPVDMALVVKVVCPRAACISRGRGSRVAGC